jgi:hypothetical protein
MMALKWIHLACASIRIGFHCTVRSRMSRDLLGTGERCSYKKKKKSKHEGSRIETQSH